MALLLFRRPASSGRGSGAAGAGDLAATPRNMAGGFSNGKGSDFRAALPKAPTTPYGAFAAAAEGMRILQVFGKINF